MDKKYCYIEYAEEKEGLSLPHKTKIPANFIANFLMDIETKIGILERNHIRINQRRDDFAETKEEINSCFNNGNGHLDLTFDQSCLLLGIATLFTKYNPSCELECLQSELFRAAGYDNPSGGQRQKLKIALEKLADEKYPICWLERGQSGRYSRWMTYDTLINVARGIEEKDENDSLKIVPSKKKKASYKIAFNWMFLGGTTVGFRLFETSICKEIREYKLSKGKYPSKFDIRFYYLLLGENKFCIKRNYLKIAKNPMGMFHLIKDKKYKDIRKKLNSIYAMFKDLGYLQDYEINKKGSRNTFDVFYLNPQRFYRLRGSKR